jgi:hypothetical protein
MQHRKSWLRGLTGVGGLVAALGIAGSAVASPISYGLLTTISVPPSADNVQPGGAFTSFDISFFDPTTNADYVADRSNAAVDIFSASSLSLIGRATGFTGQQATTSVSGPDGVLVTSPGTPKLFAGDGNSTLKSFDVSTPSSPTTLFAPIDTGGQKRVDEMAYSPSTHLVLAANNADTPAFGTLVNADTGKIVHGNIVVPNAVELEQPVWNPNTNSFFISVPSFGGDSGGVAEIKTDGTIGRIYDFSTLGIASCSPTGLALGGSGNLMVGCGNHQTQTVVLNPAGSGSIVTTLSQISGSDEIWYDPGTGDFFVTGVNAANNRVFDVFSDTSFSLLDSVPLQPVNAHSITVDPFNGNVFVPLEGTTSTATNSLCPLGCVAVYAQVAQVPEPSSLLLTLTALLGLVGHGWLRRAAL